MRCLDHFVTKESRSDRVLRGVVHRPQQKVPAEAGTSTHHPNRPSYIPDIFAAIVRRAFTHGIGPTFVSDNYFP